MDSGDSPVAGWILFVLFLIVNSIFYGFGSAIQNMNENEIEEKAEQGDKKSKRLLPIINAPSALIHTIQFYHIFFGLLIGCIHLKTVEQEVWTLFSVNVFSELSQNHGLQYLVFFLILFLDLILLTTFGILVPKRVCSHYAERSARSLVTLVQIGILLAWPFTKLMELLTNLTVRLFGIDPTHTEDDVTEDEIIDLVDEAHEQGIIQESEAEMIQNIMEFHDKSAKDIMTHRKNINALDDTMLLKDAMPYMAEHNNSRYPVFHEDIDNIVGFIHIRDAMEHQNRGEYENKSLMQIPNLVRAVAYIPETRGIDSLFQAMQTKKIHIAIVVDEYGQTAGLVTMEDILEEIVGNIFDEYDESEEFIQPQLDESLLMDGLTPLDDVEEVLNIDLGDHEVETLNGYLTSLLGHIPTGEDHEINANGYCFQILSVENNIIQKIRVEKIQ